MSSGPPRASTSAIAAIQSTSPPNRLGVPYPNGNTSVESRANGLRRYRRPDQRRDDRDRQRHSRVDEAPPLVWAGPLEEDERRRANSHPRRPDSARRTAPASRKWRRQERVHA